MSLQAIDAPNSPIPLNSGGGGRASGKNWKPTNVPSRRKHLSEGLKTKTWADRVRRRTEDEATKKLEKELKAEKEAEYTARVEKIKARRQAKADKERTELLKAKMSQKRLDRQRKKMGKTKLVNH